MKRIFLILLMGIFIISGLNFASALVSWVPITNCSAEDSSTTYNSFTSACQDSTGNRLNASDTTNETHTWAYGTPVQWGGVRINSSDTSITNCASITEVYLCYKWWDDATSKYPDTCNVTVSNNTGTSYVVVNSTCPPHTPGSVICNNITNLTSWTCSNFFGSSAKGALAAAQLTKANTPSNNANVVIDVLKFNVSYTTITYPNVSLISPNNGNQTLVNSANFSCNATGASALTNITFYWNYSGSFIANGTTALNGTFNQTSFNRSIPADGNYLWNCYACDSSNYCAFASANRTVTIDTTNPAINFTNPADSSYSFLNRNNVVVNVTSTDLTLKNITINLYNSTKNLINSSNSTISPLYFNFTGLANGIYFFNATAYDNLSHSNSTETRNITLDTINPSINFSSTAESSGSVYLRRNIQVNITINDTNFKNATIYLYNSTGLVNSTNTTVAGSLFINFTELSDNIYFFNATAFDLAGNKNSTETRNVTIDNKPPIITINSPVANFDYTTQQITINFTAADALTSISMLWFYNETGNTTYTSGTLVYQNLSYGNHTFIFYANDSLNNLNQTNITFIINSPPNITYLGAFPNPIKGGNIITVNSSVNDINNDSLNFYCSENSTTPNATNSVCTGGNTFGNAPYNLTCTYITASDTTTHNVSCRAYDNLAYSNLSSTSYSTTSTVPVTSIVSVAGDTTASYYDTNNDLRTDIIVSGNMNITCRWSISDLDYSSMTNTCRNITGTPTQQNCSVNDGAVITEGFKTRYVSCSDFVGNSQNSSQNLDVQFYVDYNAPATYDNSNTNIQVPNYTVTITENDSVDSNPVTYYCTSSSPGCNPATLIDNGSQIIYTSSNRGVNYLRYYSQDFAGNIQTTVNKTLNINQLPVFTSATDNAIVIKGGLQVNVSVVAYDSDSGQNIYLYVCNSSSANYSGCSSGTYCSSMGSGNLTCGFASESDTANHTWYAYIFDSLNESASNNPLTGVYTTDSTAPSITVNNPTNGGTVAQNSVTFTITVNEPLTDAWYSLNNGVNNISMANTSLYVYTNSNTSIANGNYNLTIWANDSYGNIGSSAISFTVDSTANDTTAPVITIVNPGNASYNNPSSLLINITANENLSWAVYQLNSGALTNLTNITGSNWNAIVSGLNQEATYNLTVYANDTSSNKNNANKSIVFYTDTLAPRYSSALAVPSPANVSQSVNCSVTWTDGFNVTNVIISENSLGVYENHTIGFSGISGSASYNISGSRLTNPGTYTCIFYATDSAGNSNSTSISFNVNDVTAPIITVVSPSNVTYNTADLPISITTNENASSAWYSLNGNPNLTLTQISPTSWNSTLTSLANGAYNIIFYANDSSNNIGNSSKIYFSINTAAPDSVPPVITIDTISNASYKTNTTVELNITTNENTTWAAYILNSGSLTPMSNSSLLKWNATLLNLGNESTNTLLVYANDSSQNKGNTNITFYVDVFPPRFLDAAASPAVANETQNVICNAYVNDTFNFGYVKISENATIPGTFLNHTIDLTSPGWANYTMSNVQKGNYTCIFYATDLAGNYNTSSITFKVNDVTAPLITINSPLNQTYSTNSILFSVSLNENATQVNYSINGAVNVSMSGSGMSWSNTVNVGADGSKTVVFYAVDGSGNLGNNSITFLVDTSLNDLTPPTITIWSPQNNSYYDSASILLNISSDEALSWAGYSNNSNAVYDLGNVSSINWNKTITLAEGNHNITFYANDSSANKNKANKSVSIYVDLTDPSVDAFSCSDTNDSKDVICNANVSDTVGLNYAIIGYNATGNWINSSAISLSGVSSTLSYIISAGNTTPGSFVAYIYLYDLSGRTNLTSSDTINIADDKFPTIWNITYYPNTTADLDPGVRVNVNATIIEDYSFGDVFFMYKNSSVSSWDFINMTNLTARNTNTGVIFNASFVPQNGTWTFRINATDAAGNQNISANYTIIVQNDTSANISTSVPSIKSVTASELSSNTSLGYLYLNNTGDGGLNFNVSITTLNLNGRININHTNDDNASYLVSSGNNLTLILEANTTGLDVGLYAYTISIVSESGTTIYERYLNIQSVPSAYLVVVIDKYSSSVIKGQTNIELIASVRNYGSQDATGVVLTWNLPSVFSLTSGSLSRNLGNVPIGSSSTNTITVSVDSSVADQVVNITANAIATGSLSSQDSKEVTIGSPVTITNIVTSPGGGGGSLAGAGGKGSENVIYTKETEVIRGTSNQFSIDVYNKYKNSELRDLTIELTGFLPQYISISPEKILKINYDETKSFFIKLSAPIYKDYEEHDLKAVIKGTLVQGGSIKSYTETQIIKLRIQEISYEQAKKEFDDANKAIEDMKNRDFNVKIVESFLSQAEDLLNKQKRYKQSFDISKQITDAKQNAVNADDLIRRIVAAMENPSKSNLIVGNIVKYIGSYDKTKPIGELLNAKSVFAGSGVENIISLGIAAFERGDYISALTRAEEARNLLILERKGNFFLFLYLYWYYIILAIFLVSSALIFIYRKYEKESISRRIEDLDREEENINGLLVETQKDYFSGKISAGEYHRLKEQNEKKISNIRNERIKMRNTRVKMLAPEQISSDLDKEKNQIEQEVKKLQEGYYKDKKISESEYKLQFANSNERLAEIEDERTTLHFLKRKPIKTNAEKKQSKEELKKNKKIDKMLEKKGFRVK